MTTETASTPEELPAVVTRLFKGVVYAETDQKIWQSLITLTSQVRDYVAVLGLSLIIDESEGYAFLKSREDPEGTLPGSSPKATHLRCQPAARPPPEADAGVRYQ